MVFWLLFLGQLTAIFLVIVRYVPPFAKDLVPSFPYPSIPLEAILFSLVLSVVPYRASHFIVGALAKWSARKLIRKPTEDGVRGALRYTTLGRKLSHGDYNLYRSTFRAVNGSARVSYEGSVALKALYEKRGVIISDTIRPKRPLPVDRGRGPATGGNGGGAYQAAQKAHQAAIQLLAKGFPTESIMNCRKAAENLVEYQLLTHYRAALGGTFDENLDLLKLKNVDRTVIDSLYIIKRHGNEAVHREEHSQATAKNVLSKLELVISWVKETQTSGGARASQFRSTSKPLR